MELLVGMERHLFNPIHPVHSLGGGKFFIVVLRICALRVLSKEEMDCEILSGQKPKFLVSPPPPPPALNSPHHVRSGNVSETAIPCHPLCYQTGRCF